MPSRHEGVGWNATSREMNIKWEEFLSFAVDGGNDNICLCLAASKLTWPRRQHQLLEQELGCLCSCLWGCKC